MWQDYVFAIGAVIFGIALLPAIRGEHKPPLLTSIPTAIILYVFAVNYSTLHLVCHDDAIHCWDTLGDFSLAEVSPEVGIAKMSGYVIAIDGPDGVGKTTQLKLLADYLKEHGQRVHTTRHNGGTAIGEELRKVSLAPLERSAETDFYISLAMGQALSEDLKQRQSGGELVLIDRSPLAIVAYQAYGSKLDNRQAAFEACERLFISEQIDLLLFLNAPQRIIDGRRDTRDTTDYFESQGVAFHLRVRDGYEAGLAFLQKNPAIGSKVVEIDASGDIPTIQQAILKALPPDITT